MRFFIVLASLCLAAAYSLEEFLASFDSGVVGENEETTNVSIKRGDITVSDDDNEETYDGPIDLVNPGDVDADKVEKQINEDDNDKDGENSTNLDFSEDKNKDSSDSDDKIINSDGDNGSDEDDVTTISSLPDDDDINNNEDDVTTNISNDDDDDINNNEDDVKTTSSLADDDDDDNESTSTTESPPTTTSPPTKKNNHKIRCRHPGNMPDPASCGYIACQPLGNGKYKKYFMRCGLGTCFDPVSMICGFDSN